MIQDDTYKTLTAPSKGSYKEKGSRFLAFAFPVVSDEEVKEQLAFLRKNIMMPGIIAMPIVLDPINLYTGSMMMVSLQEQLADPYTDRL